MKEIPLTHGQVAQVSDEDYDELSKYRWIAVWAAHAHTYYAVHCSGQNTIIMHRIILNAKPKQWVDHIDHNGLHNERTNIRFCTATENSRNCQKHRDGSSRFKGITRCKKTGKWVVRLWKDGIHYYFGYFVNEEDAARAYDTAAREHFGEFALTNFPSQL